MTTKTLEECAEVVLRKWPQMTECINCMSMGPHPCHVEGCAGHMVPITPADLLADDDGRPSKWLWALWVEHGCELSMPTLVQSSAWAICVGADIGGVGTTATEAITRALCALAEAS